MTTSELMFIYVAEKMSFTKAAEKHYISQQAVSGHIRKLEENLGTKLFVRSPRLKLTEAGKIYYESLKSIQRIEQYTLEAIADDSNQIHARLSLGVHADRGHVIFPGVFPRFHEMYSNVTVSLVNGHTNDFVEMLTRGKIDIMIGHDTEPQEDLERETIFSEGIYILATEKFLKKNLDDWNGTEEMIEPAQIARLPMTCTSFGCAVMDHINRFFIRENVLPHYLCEVVDYVTQLRLCREHHTAFFCPESYMVQRDFVEAMRAEGEDRVRALRVRHMEEKIHVELIWRKEDFMPGYLRDFRGILLEEYRKIWVSQNESEGQVPMVGSFY